MGRKKKVEETKPMEQMPLVVPIDSVAKPPMNGSAPAVGEMTIEIPISLDKVREEGIRWAEECGFKQPFNVQGPDRVNYPRYGYGYQMTVKETMGKGRLGSARFTSSGVRSYWSIDGIVTG